MRSSEIRKVRVNRSELLEAGRNAPPPVLVTGMHSSGTSILTEIIHESGIFMENSMDHYESYFFSIFINDQIIMGGSGGWAELPIMSEHEVMSLEDSVGNFIKENWIVSYIMNGYNGRSKWGFKDPRLCVLIPLYLKIFPDAKVVYIDRRSEDVAASLCQKRKEGVGNLDDLEYWKSLTSEYKSRATKFIDVHNRTHIIQYSDLCTNTIKVVEELFNFLEINMSSRTRRVCDKVHERGLDNYENYKRSKLKDWGCLLKRFTVRLRRVLKSSKESNFWF